MIVHWKYKHAFGLLELVIVSTLVILPGAFSEKSYPLEFAIEEDTDDVVGPRSLQQGGVQVRAGVGKDDCNCTSLFQCDLGGSSKESGENDTEGEDDGADLEVINIRTLGSPCAHYLEICCNHYQRNKPKAPPTVTQVNRQNIPKEKRHQCGQRNVKGVGFRIVGGIEGEAQLGEFTWMVAVTELNKEKQGTVYLCGGSLIHPRIILTAAHCVENKAPQNLTIRAGEWDTQTEREDPYVHYDRLVKEVIIHEDYVKRGVLKNDIALLVLSKDVPMARHIGTICLSPDLHPPPGFRCFASGWGKNLYGKDGNYQSILKKVDLPIVPQSECQTKFRQTSLGPKFRLHSSFVCAGGERGKDTCKGDGGSPLVCQIPGTDRYAQYGIVSWGLNCGEPIPGAYVNVPHFVPWVERKLSQLGLDSSSFKVDG